MILALWLALHLAQVAAPADANTVSGTVRDSAGAVVPGATVIARRASGAEQKTVAGKDGRFTLTVGGGDLVLIVRADGFAEQRQAVAPDARQNIDVVLAPAAVTETVIVTASRTEQAAADVPASLTVVSDEMIRRSPAVVADDVLRQVPTFSLFRRTSSLASHPTAQGVSLRGVGPSGVSRTLVLLDGIPFNDPFGGWVYWTRIPLASVDRIEIVDTPSSSLYGNYAMGGVINVMTSPPERRTIELLTQYGSRRSPKLELAGSDVWGKLAASLDASLFDTSGYPVVATSERGAVDRNAAVTFRNVNLKLQYAFTERVHAFFRGGYFHEDRDNGKVSTIDATEESNSTRWKTASGGVRVRLSGAGDLQFTVFSDFTRFRSNFLAVPASVPPRSTGRMTLNQAVPTRSAGATAQWSRPLGTRQLVSAGIDSRWVDGDSREDALDAQTGTRVTLKRISGGTQRSLGGFVQDLVTPVQGLSITIGARLDHWDSYDAHNLEAAYPSGAPTANNAPALPGRTDSVVSPRIGVVYHVSGGVSIWGDLGSGFRAPTLNELYRQFRVGNVLTLANNRLGPERLVGGDGGIRIALGPNISWKTTIFDNRVRDPVSNVTLTTAGSSVTQQRQNLGRTRIWGVQNDLEYRLGNSWSLSAGYLYDQARVREFASNPVLVGRFLPQVPKHRGSAQIAYSNPRVASAAVTIEAIGAQFDDDLNVRAVPGRGRPGLPGYAVIDFSASRAVGRGVEVFIGAQNLLDREYFVGTLPTSVGTPRTISGGLRLRLSPHQ